MSLSRGNNGIANRKSSDALKYENIKISTRLLEALKHLGWPLHGILEILRESFYMGNWNSNRRVYQSISLSLISCLTVFEGRRAINSCHRRKSKGLQN